MCRVRWELFSSSSELKGSGLEVSRPKQKPHLSELIWTFCSLREIFAPRKLLEVFSTELLDGHLVLLPFLCNRSGARLPLRANLPSLILRCVQATLSMSHQEAHTQELCRCRLFTLANRSTNLDTRTRAASIYYCFSMENKYPAEICELCDVASYRLLALLKVFLL